MSKFGPEWTRKELAFLTVHRNASSVWMSEQPEMLENGRTPGAITAKRQKMGIGPGVAAPRVDSWRPHEDAKIWTYPLSTPGHEMVHDFPGRTAAAIETRRRKLINDDVKSHNGPSPRMMQAQAVAAQKAKLRAEMAAPPPVIPPQPGEITHREIDGRKIAVVWGDDGVPIPKPSCWEPSRDGMFSALYRRNQSSLAVVPLALPAAQLGGPVAS